MPGPTELIAIILDRHVLQACDGGHDQLPRGGALQRLQLLREPRQPGKGTQFSPLGISLGLGAAKLVSGQAAPRAGNSTTSAPALSRSK